MVLFHWVARALLVTLAKFICCHQKPVSGWKKCLELLQLVLLLLLVCSHHSYYSVSHWARELHKNRGAGREEARTIIFISCRPGQNKSTFIRKSLGRMRLHGSVYVDRWTDGRGWWWWWFRGNLACENRSSILFENKGNNSQRRRNFLQFTSLPVICSTHIYCYYILCLMFPRVSLSAFKQHI